MSDYYEDEWYDDEYDGDGDWDDEWEMDSDRQIWGQSTSLYLYKGAKGKLCLVECTLTRYEGEDWGQASGWDEERINLKTLEDDVRKRVIEFGKTMPAGTAKEVAHSWFSDEPDGWYEDEQNDAISTDEDQSLSSDSPIEEIPW